MIHSDSGRFEMTPFAFTVDNLLMIFNSILQAPNSETVGPDWCGKQHSTRKAISFPCHSQDFENSIVM
jgi:hypothetical protein